MYQRWILGFSLAAGAALFGLAIRIQTDRFAFTSPSPVEALDAPAPRVADLTASTERASPELETTADSTVFMPPVEIRAERRTSAAPHPPGAAPSEPRVATEPCSPWREIGPARVNQGEPIGTRHVRELC